jgi:hypothetical protein
MGEFEDVAKNIDNFLQPVRRREPIVVMSVD